jgi:hypothetical protein
MRSGSLTMFKLNAVQSALWPSISGQRSHGARQETQEIEKRSCAALALLCIILLALVPVGAHAQTSAAWPDDLVDHMTGSWTLQGKIVGHDAHHEVRAEWVLDHQFLYIHERTAAQAPSAEHRYEASWFLGYDPVSERYVLHLLDVFGGRFSETLGYGTRDGDSIRFIFEYPDGPFHTTYRWSPQSDSWQWLMEQKDKSGKWTTFADLKLTHAPR